MTAEREVFDYYQSKGLKKLRKFETWEKPIRLRLKNFSVEDLKLCIDNMAASHWHRTSIYCGLDQIVDSDDRVRRWMTRTPSPVQRRTTLHIEPGKSYDRKADNE